MVDTQLSTPPDDRRPTDDPRHDGPMTSTRQMTNAQTVSGDDSIKYFPRNGTS